VSFADLQAAPAEELKPDPDWWRGAVIYQVYPRSFQDSNADGIGDLGGCIHRLEHIARLGADAVWLSPFFRSPMLDFGYDVSDYRDVDPMFGTLQDFDALIARAHELGLRVMIDLVMSHTSDQHPWFVESRSSRDNPKAEWYVWADPKPDGSPPNNWLSIFGGSAWEWDGTRMQYFLHNFLREQPDLNFHNPDVQDELLAMVRYWLERGVDGFRLDTVNFYFHDAELRDNPPLPEHERNDNTAPSVNPYNFQDHLYDKTRPENLEFLRRFRAVCDEFPGITSVGEVGESQRGTEVQAQYTSGGDKLHMCYDFDLLANPYPTGTRVAGVLDKIETMVGDGWACWAYSNHDVVRWRTRWNIPDEALPVYAALMFSMKGSVCLYQGEELGLGEAYVGYEDLQDPYGKRFWPKFRGRDGCRTPMPWNAEVAHGGFTDAKPWLPVAPEHLDLAVARQERDAASTLNFYRRMIGFRTSHEALRKGSYRLIEAADDYLSFVREFRGTALFCAFNLSPGDRGVAWPEGTWRIDRGAPFDVSESPDGAVLGPWQACFAIGQTQ